VPPPCPAATRSSAEEGDLKHDLAHEGSGHLNCHREHGSCRRGAAPSLSTVSTESAMSTEHAPCSRERSTKRGRESIGGFERDRGERTERGGCLCLVGRERDGRGGHWGDRHWWGEPNPKCHLYMSLGEDK